MRVLQKYGSKTVAALLDLLRANSELCSEQTILESSIILNSKLITLGAAIEFLGF